ncbi:MAG: bifunctional diguanylate cyclase/phosphodiesterase [Pseudomonadota bacterium]|nr:bifunctional diguanylate cyclase/phosphodiesterase [Pseudomonadota bacterium]
MSDERPDDLEGLIQQGLEQCDRDARLSAERDLDETTRQLVEANRELERMKAKLQNQIETLERERDRVLTISRLDQLTRLVNRSTLLGHLNEALICPLPDGQHHWLFLIDIRRFKHLNNALGQTGGDLVLKSVAQRLMDVALSNNGIAARTGGNEFAVSLALSARDAANFGDFLRSTLEAPMVIQARQVRIEVNIGGAGTNVSAPDVETIRGAADQALLECRKHKSGSHVCMFDSRLRDEIVEKADLEIRLNQAVNTNQIEPWFQPIINPNDTKRVSFEVLARWSRPTGMVPPDYFIPLATQMGIRRRLDGDLFLRATEHAVPWAKQGWLKDISFNVPPSDLILPTFMDDLDRLLAKTQLPREHIVMEITESVFIDDMDVARERLEQIGDRGIRVALDDFGTGYSNLRSMVGLPLSKIKLDRSLIADLGSQDRMATLVSTITQWARSVGIEVVAEGVETEAQMMVLKALGCTGLQGFYFGEALTAADVEKRFGQGENVVLMSPRKRA